jgi:PAS domain S-box-containing protein
MAAAALLVLLPYWWLAIHWFGAFNLPVDTTYAFTSVTLMLVMITADALFLFVYFHDANQLAIAEKNQELERREAMLQRELNLNRALADLAGLLINLGQGIDEIAALVLSSAKELTQSPEGYVSVIDEKTGVMVSPTLDAMIKGRECKVADAQEAISFPCNPDGTYAGLWGHCLNTGKPFSTNTPELHPSSAGLPDWHITISSFLAVPALIGSTVVGQIALANAPEGYTPWEETAVVRLAEIFTLAIQRARVAQSFQSKREQLALIIDGVPALIGYIDADERYLFVNQAYADWYGHPREAFIGRAIREILDDETYQHSSPFYTRVLTGEAVEMEYYTPRRDGRKRCLHVGYVPHRDESGQVIAFFTLIQDITDRKRDEEALRQANRKLSLLSGITRHDIQNQVTALLGFIDLSAEMTDDSNLQIIFRRENELVDQIRSEITFTKGYEELGIQSPEWQPVAVLIENAALSLPVGSVQVLSEVDDLEIYADPLMGRVFYNLIENALRHGPGAPEIRFSAYSDDTGRLMLVCEDDGDGVPVDQKREIFKKGVGTNTGLGLFLASEILAITGITIEETGEPGRGARFEMIVPQGGYRNFSSS